MPPLNGPLKTDEIIQEFEARHGDPEIGGLLLFAIAGVNSLYYLDDLDANYDASRNAVGGHPHDVIDVAHLRWATGTCITALDLCVAVLGRAFSGHRGPHELHIAAFDPQSCSRDRINLQRCERRRSRLPANALNWIDAVLSDSDYIRVRTVRHSLTHARLPRHWKFPLVEEIPNRLEIKIADGQQLGARAIVSLARDVATKYVTALLKELPNLSQKEHEPRTTFLERKLFLDDLKYVLDQASTYYEYWQTNADVLLANSPIRQTIQNAVLESSLCFLRKVNEFFGKSPGEISIRDYLPSEPKEYLLSKEDSILLNERVMHLSLEEVRKGKHNWKNFLDRYVPEAARRYDTFLKKLKEAHPEYFSSGD